MEVDLDLAAPPTGSGTGEWETATGAEAAGRAAEMPQPTRTERACKLNTNSLTTN